MLHINGGTYRIKQEAQLQKTTFLMNSGYLSPIGGLKSRSLYRTAKIQAGFLKDYPLQLNCVLECDTCVSSELYANYVVVLDLRTISWTISLAWWIHEDLVVLNRDIALIFVFSNFSLLLSLYFITAHMAITAYTFPQQYLHS